MSTIQEHVANAQRRGAIGLMFDVTGDMEEAISDVIDLVFGKVEAAEKEIWTESQRGAANLSRIANLRAIQEEYRTLVKELSSIHFIDHHHTLDELSAPMPDASATVDPAGESVIEPAEAPLPSSPPPASPPIQVVDFPNFMDSSASPPSVVFFPEEPQPVAMLSEEPERGGFAYNRDWEHDDIKPGEVPPGGQSQAGPSYAIDREDGRISELREASMASYDGAMGVAEDSEDVE